jgi:hypothetical protein
MIPGEARRNEPAVWLENYEVVRATASDIFRPAVRDGYFVSKNGVPGGLVDAFGARIEWVHAPFSGVVNYVLGTPPVSEGEPVAMESQLRSMGSE